MIELLVALALTGLVLTLLINHLNILAVKTAQMRQQIQAQDQAVTALLLLQRQVQSAGLTECLHSPAAIHNITDSSDFLTLAPYEILAKNDPLITRWHLDREGSGQIISNQALLLHQQVQSFSINRPSAKRGIEVVMV